MLVGSLAARVRAGLVHAACVVLGLLVPAVTLDAQDGVAPSVDTITEADLRRDVHQLADDEMAGRLVGTPGNRLARDFIAERLWELGVRAVDGQGDAPTALHHRFTLVEAQPSEPQSYRVTTADTARDGRLGVDFHPEPYSATGRATAPIVFVGFGIAAPHLGHDDYHDVDVTGRIVLLLDHEPGERDAESPFDGRRLSEHARAVRKVLAAQRRGAVGALVVSDAHNHAEADTLTDSRFVSWAAPGRTPRSQVGAWVEAVTIPVARLSTTEAARLLDGDDTPFSRVARSAERAGAAEARAVDDLRVDLHLTVERTPTPVDNVLGVIEGADPGLRDEWVIICAHYDHEGVRAEGIFRGADDDASGVAGLLEIAEAYAVAREGGRRPRRSILLAAWNAEERGMLGAWSYAAAPPGAPLAHTVAVLNLDMIGRHEEVPENPGRRFRGLAPQTADSNAEAVNLLGYSFSPDLQAAATRANAGTGLDLRFRYDDNASNLLRRSDHWPFLFHGVPALFVHTGLHPDYHTERDTPDKLAYDKMTRIVRFVHQLGWDLATSDARPAFVRPRR